MISRLRKHASRIIDPIISSIAFYPTLLGLFITLFAVLVINLENAQTVAFLKKYVPYLVINNAETARVILSTLIGGVISLTVFSFSMVMITLNQASNNFSPRLIPGLISEKKNQLVLGLYLGTVIYNIIVLISILPSGDSYTLNVLSILVGISLGIICLAFFVYFIHNISLSIQIDNILVGIFNDTNKELDHALEKQTDESSVIQLEDWHEIKSNDSRYFQKYVTEALLDISEQKNVDLYVTAYPGQFIFKHDTIAYYKGAKDDSLEEKVLANLYFDITNNSKSAICEGFDYLTEIGLKAMSPGINDPATAHSALDYLSILFDKRLRLSDHRVLPNDTGSNVVIISRRPFCELFEHCTIQFRTYSKHDTVLMKRILAMMQFLLTAEAINLDYKKTIKEQIKALNSDIENNIKNHTDKNNIRSLET